MPELVKHGETGFLVEGEDEMVEMINRLQTLERGACRAWLRIRAVQRPEDSVPGGTPKIGRGWPDCHNQRLREEDTGDDSQRSGRRFVGYRRDQIAWPACGA